jgi:hypothetical protein
MNSPKPEQKHEVSEYLKTITPSLTQLLENAPSHGTCGIEFCFKDSEIVRIVMKAEISRLCNPAAK